jgi:hypothetical protein
MYVFLLFIAALHAATVPLRSHERLSQGRTDGLCGAAVARRSWRTARARTGAPAEDEEGQPNWGAQARDGQLARDLRGAVPNVEDASAQTIVLRYRAVSAPAPDLGRPGAGNGPAGAHLGRQVQVVHELQGGEGHIAAGRGRMISSRLITRTMLRRLKHGLGTTYGRYM